MRRSIVLWIVVLAVAVGAACSKKGVEMKEGGTAKGRTFTVDNSGDAGLYISLDIGANDSIQMVYYDKKNKSLKYVRQSAAGFAIDTVDDTCKSCLYATIRLTGDGEPGIAYYSEAAQSLLYAYKKDSKWKREPIEWGKGNGMGARLLVDENQQLHALYYSGDGFLKHAWRVPRPPDTEPPAAPKPPPKKETKPAAPPQELSEGIWGVEQVDHANGSEQVLISFVRQPKGKLAASYFSWSGMSSELKLAIQGQDSSWAPEVAARENNPGKASALFFTASGEPQIVFREALKDRLMLAHLSAEGWVAVPLISDAYNMALASDAAGNLAVAYEELSGADPRKGHLRLAWRKDGVWTRFDIDPEAGSGSFLDVGFNLHSKPVVAYYDETGHRLKLFVAE